MDKPTDIRSRQKPPPKLRSTPCRVPLRLYLLAFTRFIDWPPAANEANIGGRP